MSARVCVRERRRDSELLRLVSLLSQTDRKMAVSFKFLLLIVFFCFFCFFTKESSDINMKSCELQLLRFQSVCFKCTSFELIWTLLMYQSPLYNQHCSFMCAASAASLSDTVTKRKKSHLCSWFTVTYHLHAISHACTPHTLTMDRLDLIQLYLC